MLWHHLMIADEDRNRDKRNEDGATVVPKLLPFGFKSFLLCFSGGSAAPVYSRLPCDVSPDLRPAGHTNMAEFRC